MKNTWPRFVFWYMGLFLSFFVGVLVFDASDARHLAFPCTYIFVSLLKRLKPLGQYLVNVVRYKG